MTKTDTKFNPAEFEPKWQKKWEEVGLFQDTIRFVNQHFDSTSVSLANQQRSSSKAQRRSQSEVSQNVINSASNSKKLYLLFAFAYPSGSGLHVGHVESKTALDIMARYYRMQGRDVFFPVGWDAFGLPAENYAIKTGVHPATTTKNAINTFRRQIKRIGISYDWAHELATCHPQYYKWTQWLFLKLYEKGLAYKSLAPVNWCPSCQTVLANEQVVNGACERCGTLVAQKELNQWFFKITDYKDELIEGLDHVDWPAATKQQQINWIGRSEGANVKFQISPPKADRPLGENDKSKNEYLEVFTTAHDTIFGCTFMVVAPEHPFLQKHKSRITNWDEVSTYIDKTRSKTELERQSNRRKTGLMVKGIELVNPINGKNVPLYMADYVLLGYGTGAIMAVPGQDERDYEFAQEYNLPVIFTAKSKNSPAGDSVFTSYSTIKEHRKEYVLINSGEFDGLDYEEGRRKILESLKSVGSGESKTTYKLRDWLISRQRYWGAPIPIVYDPDGNAHPVKMEHLPWLLPTDVEFKPTGKSPLTYSKEFIARTEKLYGKGWRPEFDTMDTFVDSSWYYLGYPNRRMPEWNSLSAKAKMATLSHGQMVESKKKSSHLAMQPFNNEVTTKWLPVDFYMIGPEHIVLHLLYSRFFTKFLRDEGLLEFDEPFMKMRHQGMILGPDHRKMSKSKGNVIDPDTVISEYGADTLRLYEMFLGPIEDEKPWNTESVIGPYKFLKKIFDLFKENSKLKTTVELERELHKAIKSVGEDIVNLKFNTAIATLMELINVWKRPGMTMSFDDMSAFLKILAPFAPFLSEELFQILQSKSETRNSKLEIRNSSFRSVHTERWPTYNPKLLVSDTVSIVVQVNGRLRGNLICSHQQSTDQSAIDNLAQKDEKIGTWLKGGFKKAIFVPGRLINFVV